MTVTIPFYAQLPLCVDQYGHKYALGPHHPSTPGV